ncbi:MAG: hypothetical protein U0354_15580 [Candidatus Sericytochromatia bacterium]
MNYWYNPKLYSERVSENIIEKNNKIIAQWNTIQYDISKHNSYLNIIESELFFDTELKTFNFYDRRPPKDNIISLSSCISSALALYSIASCFDINVSLSGKSGYKSIWKITLEHKQSSQYIVLGDYKGAFQVFMPFTKKEQIPEELQKDIIELLNLFVSGNLNHPYDGTICGTVA